MTILIVTARFYEDIADALLQGATDALDKTGTAYEVLEVPGALEIPPAIRLGIANGKYDGYIALGCVIRGETSHYDTVCNESARGLMDMALTHCAPIGNGILTVENRDQAMARASIDQMNKGGGATIACLSLLQTKQKLGANA